MLKGLAFGFGAIFAWAIWNQASLPNGSNVLVASGFVLAVVLAYYGGRAKRPMAVATATANANAEATANAQQAVVVNVALGARDQARAQFGSLDGVSWQQPASALEMLDVDQVESEGIYEVMHEHTQAREGEAKQAAG